MSWHCLTGNKESVARKKHRCMVCDGVIQKGEKQITRSGVNSGEGFIRMHMHLECEKYSRDWDQDAWDSHIPGDVSRSEVKRELSTAKNEPSIPS